MAIPMKRQSHISLDSLTKQDFPMINKLTREQEEFANSIFNNILTISNSRAGTGKSTVSTMAMNALLKKGIIDKVYYVINPIQEKAVGHLPGELNLKIIRYATAFIQALGECNISQRGLDPLEICDEDSDGDFKAVTHSFMRGINIKRSGVLIDEMQNLDIDSIQKILTRCDDNCHIVMMGHSDQTDIPISKSGFEKYINHFKRGKEFGEFNSVDFVDLTQNFRGKLSSYADTIIK